MTALSRGRLIVLALSASLLGPPRAHAWPAELSESIARDAMKLLPRSLVELFLANEAEIFSGARTSNVPVLPLLYEGLSQGRLSTATMKALGEELQNRAKALHGPSFRSAVIALGASYRLAVDLADPGVGSGLGSDAKAKAIRREFYLYVGAHRDKFPLVLSEPDSMKLTLDAVPEFLAGQLAKTPNRTALLRVEGQEGGRVLRYSEIDFLSPVFAVASTAYSRSVCAVAATWIAVWRSAGGDMKRQRPPRIINPWPKEQN